MAVFKPTGPYNLALRGYIPSAPEGQHWEWEALNNCEPVAHEWVYSCNELYSTMRVTLLALARTLHREPRAWRIAVVAECIETGRIIGRDTWRWSRMYGKHLPEDAPMCVAALTAKELGLGHRWNLSKANRLGLNDGKRWDLLGH